LTHNVKLVLCQTKYSLKYVPSYLILEETLLPAATAGWRSSLVLRNVYAQRYTWCAKRYHQHRRYAFSINNTFVWIMTSELLDVYTDTFHSAGWTEMYHFTLPNSKHSSICNYMFSVTLILQWILVGEDKFVFLNSDIFSGIYHTISWRSQFLISFHSCHHSWLCEFSDPWWLSYLRV